MTKHLTPILMVVFLASPLTAEPLMDADAFEAYSLGKTLYYEFGGTNFGAEQYLPNNRVRWSYDGGECTEGTWYQEGELICFVYEDDPNPKCWSFFQRDGRLVALFENNPNAAALFEVRQSTKPLQCLGPKIGV